jgi:polygalacturonase
MNSSRVSTIAVILWSACLFGATPPRASYDVRSFGATGDGATLDTAAINKAIDAASAAGGGTVVFPAGSYLSGSIHLKSHVALYLGQGATIVASGDPLAYDPPEPNPWDKYQDFGHSHWHNGLIWGENLEDISILGPGAIYGKGLTRADKPGVGDKAIALKLCRNVTIRDITILHGGHFGILATGVDNFIVAGIKIDTNRDGIDIDSCRNVRVSDISVNSPFDDGICLKADYSLGFFRDTENVTITNSEVSGFDEGTFLDGTYQSKTFANRPGHSGPTGRIKFGTESSGGFKNITISNCVFDHSQGLALETVDGGDLEDVTISNITMRDVSNSPIFLRLGERLRSPEGTPVGHLRRVNIANVVVYGSNPRYASVISGIPGHEIEDVRLSNIQFYYDGGGTAADAALVLAEKERAYPEPTMFGTTPAYAFYIRHVKGIEFDNVQVHFLHSDARPAFVFHDVQGIELNNLKAQHAPDVPALELRNVEGLKVHNSDGLPDTSIQNVPEKDM